MSKRESIEWAGTFLVEMKGRYANLTAFEMSDGTSVSLGGNRGRDEKKEASVPG